MEPDFLAIVDPWVTTLSFVVALAMRIQGEKNMQENEKVNKRGISLLAKQAREAWQE